MSKNASSGRTIVVDIGTGSAKSVLFDNYRLPVHAEVGRYPAGSETGGEIDPEVWWNAFRQALLALGRSADLSAVNRIVLTGQMQNLILLRGGETTSLTAAGGEAVAVRSAILYHDTRGEDYLERLYERIPRERLIAITGNTPDGSGFPAKLLALEVSGTAYDRLFCGAHDFVAYRLTGTARTDRTTAGTTGLLDIRAGDWSAEIADAIGIDRDCLPEVCSASAVDGIVPPDLARELGLPGSVQVIHGAGDVGASVLASELTGGRVGCYLGTSGWVLDEAAAGQLGDPETGVFNLPHPITPGIVRVAPLLTAAGAVEWLSEILSSDETERIALFRTLGSAAAERVGPSGKSPTGIMFLPHLAGERSPFKDPAASGAFIGLRRETDRVTLFKAVLEGVSFAVRSVLEPLAANRGATEELLVSGGGATIPGWPELLADVSGVPVRVAADARFAGGRGMLRVLDAGHHAPGTASAPPGDDGPDEPVFAANTERHAAYDAYYRVFARVYPSLGEIMHSIHALNMQRT